jgi:sugar lactone lactonase YvrE
MRTLVRIVIALVLALALGALGLRACYGGGERFPEREVGVPELPESALEVVAELALPPGNVAVSSEGRLFFSFHPEAGPAVQVAEWVDGRAVPYPPGGLPPELAYQSVLSLRIDRQQRLWVLDNANHGSGTPRLLAFDLVSDRLLRHHDFPDEIAPLGSHLNDFQVTQDGQRIYIADASILGRRPALVLHDVERGSSRRVLEGHDGVVPDRYVPYVQGRRMELFGLFAIRPGVDSIALDRSGEWLYFAPVTDEWMWRVRRADLDDASLTPQDLAAKVERYAEKTESDGITTDFEGNVYLTDPGSSAIVLLTPERRLQTLVQSERLRWPDGLSFGPNGTLYVTCSALHHVIGRSPAHTASQAPFQIFRLRPGRDAVPGH